MVPLLAVIAILPPHIVAEASPIVGRYLTNDSVKHATKRSDIAVSAIQRDFWSRFRENSSSPVLDSPSEPPSPWAAPIGRLLQLWSSLAPGIGQCVRAMDSSSCFCQSWLARPRL